MQYGTWKAILLSAAILVQFVVSPQPTYAGPIIDWLFHRTPANSAAYAQPIYGQPALTQPSVSYGTACDPCAQQVTQRVVANYMPETYFRTTWVQVPVTSYRPVSAVDPGTCCPVTTLRPCTTYMWQARRIPSYTTFRPVYTAFAAPLATTACAPISGPACGGGCSSCGVSTPAAAPYYAPSATVGPGTTLPSSGLPTTLGSGVPTPADVQPSLTPGGVQRTVPSTRNYPDYSDPVVPAPEPATVVPLNSPAAQKKPAKDGGLRFVPDPDAPLTEEPNRAPRLLSPQDKTAAASLRREWASTPIQWSHVRPASAEAPVGSEPAATRPNKETWDDSGWHSLGR